MSHRASRERCSEYARLFCRASIREIWLLGGCMQKVLKPFTAADEAKVMWQNTARLLHLSDRG